jgi:hypothetical protein
MVNRTYTTKSKPRTTGVRVANIRKLSWLARAADRKWWDELDLVAQKLNRIGFKTDYFRKSAAAGGAVYKHT